jgi:general secretion pathway protein C
MLARLSAFAIWALVAATAVFWGLRLWVRAPTAPAYAVAVDDATAVRGDLSRLLGAAPVTAVAATSAIAPEGASRLRLLGVMAPKSAAGATAAAHGVALIAVDGKMPKAYAVGARIDGDLILKSVSLRTVSIAAESGGAQAITLELPPQSAAATGTLPAGGSFAPPAPAVPVPATVAAPMPPPAAPAMAPPQGMPLSATPVPPRPEPNPRVQ